MLKRKRSNPISLNNKITIICGTIVAITGTISSLYDLVIKILKPSKTILYSTKIGTYKDETSLFLELGIGAIVIGLSVIGIAIYKHKKEWEGVL